MSDLQHLLKANQRWASQRKQDNPQFFSDLAEQQNPDYLWIGCSDSRVPANQVVDTQPGEIFVHRNIANLVYPDDTNTSSVIQFAVQALQVEHIIVCGHYRCGGVLAALQQNTEGPVDKWLAGIRELAQTHQAELYTLDEEDRGQRLCELNVLAQLRSVAANPVVQQAWADGQSLHIHGWIYDLRDGLIKVLAPALDAPL